MITVVLYEPEKPANTGNIIRTCQAFDMKLAIVGKPSFEISDKALRRAEMDYAIGFEIEQYPDYETFLTRHKEEGYYVTRYSDRTYSNYDFSDVKKDIFLMFGKESTGIPKDILKKHLDHCMRIPMTIDSRSLNLSNSVAIVASEVLRQRNFAGLSTVETIKGRDFLKNWDPEKDR